MFLEAKRIVSIQLLFIDLSSGKEDLHGARWVYFIDTLYDVNPGKLLLDLKSYLTNIANYRFLGIFNGNVLKLL